MVVTMMGSSLIIIIIVVVVVPPREVAILGTVRPIKKHWKSVSLHFTQQKISNSDIGTAVARCNAPNWLMLQSGVPHEKSAVLFKWRSSLELFQIGQKICGNGAELCR